MEQEHISFSEYLGRRQEGDEINFFENPVIKKAYYIGGYAKAVILSSYMSEVSRNNKTFKNWLSNQIINYRNLDRIFEMAFRFEQKLKLNLKNDSEVRKLAHETPAIKSPGIASAQISFAFVAGFDDYGRFVAENKTVNN
jgi:hypothetical protein